MTSTNTKNRIVLIGCGSAKRSISVPARDLYTGTLFRARRAYAEMLEAERGYPWWIISARYGLVRPDVEIAPYDRKISDLAPVDRAAWYVGVLQELLTVLDDRADPRGIVLEMHAGAEYTEQLRDVARAVGFKVDWPVEGRGIGEQMAWYKNDGPSRKFGP